MSGGDRGVLGGPRTARDRVTIYEVAKKAGVSIATVSHALNRPEKVNSVTRERVLEAVDELGFTPKASAVSLARKGVGRIGVLAAFSAYPTYLTRLTGVMDACRDKFMDVVVFDAGPVDNDLAPWLSTLPATGRLDGLLIMGAHLDEASANRLLQRNLPTVLVDSTHPAFSSVNVDDEMSGYLLGRHLVEKGYETFALATPAPPSPDFQTAGEHRFSGLVRALSGAGISMERSTMLVTEDDFEGGVAAAEDLLKLEARPQVVIANHDGIAAGVYAGLRRAGIDVPQQVAITGCDGLDLAAALEITTVRQPFAETGRLATQLLLDALNGTEGPRQQIRLTPELIVGSTT